MGSRKFLPFLSLLTFFMIARGVVLPILSPYFESLGLSIIDIGLAFALYGFSLLIFEILWGFVADRVNREILMPIIIGTACLDFLLFTLSRSFTFVLFCQIIMALFLSGIGVVARLRIAELSGQSERGWAFGLLGSTFGLSIVVGSFIDSVIASRVTTYDPYFYVAMLLALIPFVPFLFLFRVRSEGIRPEPLDDAPAAPVRRSPLKGSELVLLCIVAISIFSSWGLFNSLMSLIVTKTAVGVTAPQAYLTPGVFNLSSLLLQPFMGKLGSRRPHLWITLGVGVNAATLFALTLTNSILTIYLLTFIAGACFATVSPASLSRLMARFPRNYHGRVLGIYGGAEDIGIIIGPFVGSVVWQLFGVRTSFLSIALVLVVALLIYVTGTRPRQIKTNETQILAATDKSVS